MRQRFVKGCYFRQPYATISGRMLHGDEWGLYFAAKGRCTMDIRALYNQVLDEIEEDERLLGEKKTLARLLQKRIAALPASGAALVMPAVTAAGGASRSFVQQVEDIMPAMSGREFVVSDVADALRKAGVELEDKPNPKITTVLARLTATGALVKTFTGAGNVPNRYKLAGGPVASDSFKGEAVAHSHEEQEAPQSSAP